MRAMLVSPSMNVGGAERLVVELARSLGERGVEVMLAAPSGPRDPELADAAVERILFSERGRSARGVLEPTLRTAGAVRRWRPDVVHAHNPRMTLAAAAAVRATRPRRRPPVVSTFQGAEPDEYSAVARVLRAADAAVTVSQDVVRRLEASGYPAGRLTVIPNPAWPAPPLSGARRRQLDEELGLAGAWVVSVVGRLVPQKAHHRFLEAARIVREELPETRFLVVGDGPLRGELERLAASLGIEDRVRFTGLRPDARELIARSDVLVFSSDWEGLSLAGLEALAAGVPVVSTPAEGMVELLGSGAGIVLPDRDANTLADAIAGLLRDHGRRAAMGAAARRAAERFRPDDVVDAYFQLYRRLAS